MDPNTPQIVERLAWEGLISGPTALAIFIAFALIAAWALWRERSGVGRGWAATFWVLRCAAFGCALWMLAGPTQQRIERTKTSQSIAIFADRSESMEVVDAPEAADALRWTLASDEETGQSPVELCDRLGVDLGMALAECDRFSAQLREHRPTKQLAELLELIEKAIQRAAEHADGLVESVDREDSSLAQRASRIAAQLQGSVSEALAANRKALAGSDHVENDVVAAKHEQIAQGIAGARRRASVLAADLLQNEAAGAAKNTAETDALTRREKA
jgi:hypothetical protein